MRLLSLVVGKLTNLQYGNQAELRVWYSSAAIVVKIPELGRRKVGVAGATEIPIEVN